MAYQANKQPRGKSKLLRWALRILVIAILGTGVALWFKFRPQKVIVVKTAKLETGTIYDLVNSESAGDLLSKQIATVRSQINGQVTIIQKKENDRVQKGDLIVVLDDKDVLAQIHQAETSIQSAQMQISQAKSRENTLRSQLKLAQDLQKRGAGTPQAVRDAQNALLEASAAQRVAYAQVNQSRAAKQVLEVSLTRTKFYAPFDGVLTKLPIHVGDSINPGNTIFEIMNEDDVYVEVNISEADSNKIKKGQQVKLLLDSLPNTPILGIVSIVDPILKKDHKGSRLLKVEIQIQNLEEAKKLGLKLGMSANAELTVAKKENVLMVPSNTVIGKGLERFVYLLKSEGKFYRIKKIKIQTGLSNWEWTEVISLQGPDFLKVGDLVVTSLNDVGVEDGALVSIISQ